MAASRLPDAASARSLATNPTTEPDALRHLARHRDRSVRAAVARNPNTPLDVLGSLGRLFPEELCNNPVLDWLCLEDANWLALFDDRAREQLLGADGLPHSLQWWSARSGNDRDRLAVTANRSASPDVLELLSTDIDPEVRAAATRHALIEPDADPEPRRTPSTTAPLITAGSHVGDIISLILAGEVPGWLLELVALDDVELRRAVAAWSGTPHALILRLCVDDDADVRAFARTNTSIEPATRTLLAAVDHYAQNGSGADVDVDALLQLPQTAWVRLARAAHPSLAAAEHTALVSDGEWRVRERAATNPLLGASDAVRLAADSDKDVRVAVARNAATPGYLADLLRTDRNDDVRAAAAARPQESAGVHRDANDGLALLSTMAQTVESVVVLLARHPRIEPDVLSQLASDDDWRVREAVACNPTCSVELLARLVQDSDPDVRRCAVTNAHATPAIIESREDDEHESVRVAIGRVTTSPTLLRRLCIDRSWAVREAVSRNKCAPREAVLVLASDADASVRAAVATRPDLDNNSLRALVVDADSDLRVTLLARGDLDMSIVRSIFEAEGGVRQAGRFQEFAARSLPANELITLLRRSPWLRDRVLYEASPSVLPDLLVSLSRSPDWRTRVVAVAHPLIPVANLVRLSRDTDYDVRAAVASHPALPSACVADLAVDVQGAVRMAIANRADTHRSVLAELVFDDDDAVRRAVLAHRELPPAARHEHDALMGRSPLPADVLYRLAAGTAVIRQRVAEHPDTTPRVLRRLVRDDTWRVRESVASHGRATSAMLTRLASDADRDVRRAVASNRHTPAAVLRELLHDSDASVRNAAIANRSVPQIARDLAVRATLRRLLRSHEQIASVVVASNAMLHPSVLGRRSLWCSPMWRVRLALARNPATPRAVIETLRRDANTDVAAAAFATMGEGSILMPLSGL